MGMTFCAVMQHMLFCATENGGILSPLATVLHELERYSARWVSDHYAYFVSDPRSFLNEMSELT